MYPYFNQPISDDQKSVTVSRTFDGLNVLEDSLVCQFEVSDFYETPIRFDYENIKKGEFSPSTYRVQYFDIDDKLVVEKHGSYNYGQKWGGVVYYKIWTFHGSKE